MRSRPLNHPNDISDFKSEAVPIRLPQLLLLLRENRVLRFGGELDGFGPTTIELHPSAFDAKPAATEETPEDPDKDCQCGHPLLSAHNAAGCLLGCAIDTCKMGEPEGTEP